MVSKTFDGKERFQKPLGEIVRRLLFLDVVIDGRDIYIRGFNSL